MMVEEWKAQGETNEDIAKYVSFVVTWKKPQTVRKEIEACALTKASLEKNTRRLQKKL